MSVESKDSQVKGNSFGSGKERIAARAAAEREAAIQAIREQKPWEKAGEVVERMFATLDQDQPQNVSAREVGVIIDRYIEHQVKSISETVGTSASAKDALYRQLLDEAHILRETSFITLPQEQRAISKILPEMVKLLGQK